MEDQTCAWFALCDEPADSTLPHPTLGATPVCARHRAWVLEKAGGNYNGAEA